MCVRQEWPIVTYRRWDWLRSGRDRRLGPDNRFEPAVSPHDSVLVATRR